MDTIEKIATDSEVSRIFAEAKQRNKTGFCAVCGDSNIVPFLWVIGKRNGEEKDKMKLPVQLCPKCKTIYTQLDIMGQFIDSIVTNMGGLLSR